MKKMFTCINCGAHMDELFRKYSSTVLQVLSCENCGDLADKYIEYDPVIVLLDLVLLEKPAYRHLLYNSDFNSYWKLLIVLILGESFHKWTSYEEQLKISSLKSDRMTSDSLVIPHIGQFEINNKTVNTAIFQGERNFYLMLIQTAISLAVFVFVVLIITELRWLIFGDRPQRYKPEDLVRALVIGGCAKLLALLGIVWQHVVPEPHNVLIYGYTILCLLTAYSVVCESGRSGSLIGLAGGLWAHNYVYKILDQYLPTTNMTLLQN